jgi:hypothetical protein
VRYGTAEQVQARHEAPRPAAAVRASGCGAQLINGRRRLDAAPILGGAVQPPPLRRLAFVRIHYGSPPAPTTMKRSIRLIARPILGSAGGGSLRSQQ